VSLNARSPVIVDPIETEIGDDIFRAALPSVLSNGTSKSPPVDHIALKPISGKSLDRLKLDPNQIYKLFLM
jgi:hypothetical protein